MSSTDLSLRSCSDEVAGVNRHVFVSRPTPTKTPYSRTDDGE